MTTTRHAVLGSCVIAFAAALGCYTGNAVDVNRAATGDPQAGVEDSTMAIFDGGAMTAAATGLPCDIHELLQKKCTFCHGAHPVGGAPMSLVTYEDLAANSASIEGKTVAEVTLDRLKSTMRPMPPSGLLPAADISKFEAWLLDGMERGSCGATTPDASAPNPQTPHPLPPAPSAGGSCTSGKHFSDDSPPSTVMNPGRACITCHGENGGRALSFAGTVFPSLHEEDDCNGTAGKATVLLIDAQGKTHTMAVNAVGNFFRVTNIPLPYRAMVIRGLETREMQTPQTSGDCNGCHTQDGTNGAPGRIMAP